LTILISYLLFIGLKKYSFIPVFIGLELMPYLFLGIHLPENYFSHFFMFGKHKESWSKKLNSNQRKK